MFIIGLTGGIGSGKTQVLRILKEKYNAYIVEADAVAHRIMQPGEETYQEIVDTFGRDILSPDETIDRIRLGKIVFEDENRLKCLNAIVHPGVKRFILKEIEREEKSKRQFFVIEAALLIQDGYSSICHSMWYVYADVDTRITRLIAGRGYDEARAKSVIAAQEPEEYYRSNSDVIIDNSDSLGETELRVDEAIKKLYC
jgi:dephospho-CoA kinase